MNAQKISIFTWVIYQNMLEQNVAALDQFEDWLWFGCLAHFSISV